MVAVMTDLLELKPDDMVLKIGTGLGYQAAVLAELAGKVYSVEIIDELAQRAIRRLKQQGHTNVEVRIGNGYAGWPEHAPFDNRFIPQGAPTSTRLGGRHCLCPNIVCPRPNAVNLLLAQPPGRGTSVGTRRHLTLEAYCRSLS